MSKMYTFFLAFLWIVWLGCNSDDANEHRDENASTIKLNNERENLNISILLDLSDRIDPKANANNAMEFYKRDLGYIESISKTFEQHLKSKPIIQDDDQIQVYFEPEPLNEQINNFAKALKFSFTKDNATKDAIMKVSRQYISTSKQLYKLAIKDQQYVGSDIWSFFKNKVNDYCIKPDHRNILFILTDGYMFHKDSKFENAGKTSYLIPGMAKRLKLNTPSYKAEMAKKGLGFVKANDDLSNLEVVVLGINPAKGNPFEGDVIKAYWFNWFNEMRIKNPVVKLTDLPSNLDPVIKKYIIH